MFIKLCNLKLERINSEIFVDFIIFELKNPSLNYIKLIYYLLQNISHFEK